MYSWRHTTQFKKDVKRCLKQGKDLTLFKTFHEILVSGALLPSKYGDHPLIGKWKGYRDSHLLPDWIVIYRLNAASQEVEYARMGSHAEIFKK